MDRQGQRRKTGCLGGGGGGGRGGGAGICFCLLHSEFTVDREEAAAYVSQEKVCVLSLGLRLCLGCSRREAGAGSCLLFLVFGVEVGGVGGGGGKGEELFACNLPLQRSVSNSSDARVGPQTCEGPGG